MLAVWRTETVVAAGQKRFGGGRRGPEKRVHLGGLDDYHARHFQNRVFAGDVAQTVGEPGVPHGERAQRCGLLLALRSFKDKHVIDLAARLIDARDRRD